MTCKRQVNVDVVSNESDIKRETDFTVVISDSAVAKSKNMTYNFFFSCRYNAYVHNSQSDIQIIIIKIITTNDGQLHIFILKLSQSPPSDPFPPPAKSSPRKH